MMKSLNKQSGVTLIEVLVTLVIMSVALSGIAAMQISSMQSASQVKYRSAAITSAQSILDTMRVSRIGSTSAESLQNLQNYVGSSDSAPTSPNRVKWDYVHFKDDLNASLQNRQPQFTIEVNNDRLATVTISWVQRADADEGTVRKTYTVSANL